MISKLFIDVSSSIICHSDSWDHYHITSSLDIYQGVGKFSSSNFIPNFDILSWFVEIPSINTCREQCSTDFNEETALEMISW